MKTFVCIKGCTSLTVGRSYSILNKRRIKTGEIQVTVLNDNKFLHSYDESFFEYHSDQDRFKWPTIPDHKRCICGEDHRTLRRVESTNFIIWGEVCNNCLPHVCDMIQICGKTYYKLKQNLPKQTIKHIKPAPNIIKYIQNLREKLCR